MDDSMSVGEIIVELQKHNPGKKAVMIGDNGVVSAIRRVATCGLIEGPEEQYVPDESDTASEKFVLLDADNAWEALVARRAEVDFLNARGKIFKVREATISNGSDCDVRDFPYGLRVMVPEDAEFNPSDLVYRTPREGGMLDVYWTAEALPGQLAEDEHVSWIYGPSYYRDGLVEDPHKLLEEAKGAA
jgi:hypothetical protein